MLFNSPLSAEKANQLIKLLDLNSDCRILDVGCGNGEFLIRVIEATGAHGLGIDIDTRSISAAQKNANGRIPARSYEFRTADIQQITLAKTVLTWQFVLAQPMLLAVGGPPIPMLFNH